MKRKSIKNIIKQFRHSVFRKSLQIAALTFMVISILCIVDKENIRADSKEQSVSNDTIISKIYSTKKGTKIVWTAPKKYAGYAIYRKIDNGKYEKIDYSKSKKYTDSDIETGRTYKYKVRPYVIKKGKYKYAKKSGASMSYVALPFGVESVNVVNFSDHKFVSWKTNPYASGYTIYRKEKNGEWQFLTRTTTDTDYIEDYDVDMKMSHTYKVSAFEIVDGETYESVYTVSVNSKDVKGIDVSYHNGKINWKKVKNSGISFAMIRMGYGTSKGGIIDSKLDYNYKNAKKNGIKVGLYLYSYADNIKEAKNEAKFAVKMLKTYSDLDYPIAFDFENTYRNKKKYKKANTKIITTFCDYVEKQGYDTSVYSYLGFLKNSVYYNKISKYGVWLARWTENPKQFDNSGIQNVQMWQYSDKGKVKGINTRVDMNLIIK